MKSAERELLVALRRALLKLHKTLLDWERGVYEKFHGRTAAGTLLNVVMNDPQFAWLRPVSELIVRIDEALEERRQGVPADREERRQGVPGDRAADADADVDVDAILAQARRLVAPDEAGSPYARRYHEALQEHPDAVFAHRDVALVLKDTGPKETLH